MTPSAETSTPSTTPLLERDLTPVLHFGRFALHRCERLLLLDRSPVPLSPPRVALLQALLDAGGDTLSAARLQDQLRDRPPQVPALGPGKTDAPVDLQVGAHIAAQDATQVAAHVAALNRLLGSGGPHYIAELPGSGYRFVGAVSAGAPVESGVIDHAPGLPLPRAIGQKIVGRDATIASVVSLLQSRRLLTLVGAGGMGKTTVAVQALLPLREAFPDGIVFVDLASLPSVGLLPGTVAGQLGLATDLKGGEAALRERLRRRLEGCRMLFVLDNCEPMTEGAAALCETLLAAGGVQVLATSREPLGVPGEALYQLPALSFPVGGEPLSSHEALRYGAVELFVERARLRPALASLDPTRLTRIGELCRRLDGLPLAIELAAAHVEALGIDALLAQVADQLLRLGTGDMDRSLARHRTLQATLDWSHALLGADERVVLRRLAVFRGRFGLESALRVAVDAQMDTARAMDAVLGLATRSLLTVEAARGAVDYRLLESTRAYALARLDDSGEVRQALHRHAVECRDRLGHADVGGLTTGTSRIWADRHGHLVDDMRAALDWAVSDGGDPLLAAEIVMAAMPLAGRLTLMSEFGDRLRQVIGALEDRGLLTPRLQFELYSALGEILALPAGPEEARKAYDKAHEHLHALSSPEDRHLALVTSWRTAHMAGDYDRLHRSAEAMLVLAEDLRDPAQIVYALRAMMFACHYRGDLDGATRYAQRLLDFPTTSLPEAYYHQAALDRRVSARVVQTRTLWLRGLPDQAAAMARETMRHAVEDKPHSLAIAIVLAAGPVTLWRGDDVLAAEMVERVRRHAVEHGFNYDDEWVTLYGWVLDRRAQTDAEIDPPWPPSGARTAVHEEMLATLDPALLTDATLARAERGICDWCAPELMRAKALRLVAAGSAAKAEALLQRALQLARFQGALSWELRIATTLAALWAEGPRSGGSAALLRGVLARFTEGHDTADLRQAAALLQRLAG